MIHVGDVMRECRRYFPLGYTHGAWRIEGGMLTPDKGMQPGDWVAVSGSAYHDGVHQLDENGLLHAAGDECFTGSVWRLAPPRDFLDLCERIAAYDGAHPAAPVTSESFGAYSVSLASGAEARWQAVFAPELKTWRRMFPEVHV